VKAAWNALQEMFSGLDRLNVELTKEGKHPLSMVAGMAVGQAVVGHVGARTRFNYTAVGDAANVAARLQEDAKRHGARAVLAGPARDRLPEAPLEALGALQIGGHDPVEGWAWR
jgi:adenylate cyclase